METWTDSSPGLAQQGPDRAYNQGGHFNLDLSSSALQTALGNSASAFQAFQQAVLGRSDPDPQAGGGALHGGVSRGGMFDKFHLDSANATGDLVGLGHHFWHDVVQGNIGTPCLDTAFNNP
jgi:hypothetical protein